ncbi:MAG: hypothetical protein RSG53_00755 [Oscillospiraceae bacterium]
MKKILTAIAVVLLVSAALISCKTKEDEPQTQIPNPMVEEKNSDAFEAAGIKLEAPEEASDVKYYIIAGELAQITFALDGDEYTFRAAKTDEDISGICEVFEEDTHIIKKTSDDGEVDISVRRTKNGAYVGSWRLGKTQYSLSCLSGIESDKMYQACDDLFELVLSR